MSRLIAIIVGLVLIVVALAVVLPFVIPAEAYKPRIIALVKSQTGRDLTINGPISFAFIPQIALRVEDARFANAAWAKDTDMVAMKELRATLKIMPLFRGEVEVGSFVLVDPVIHMEVSRDGTPNWQFAPQAASPTPATKATASDSGRPSIKQVRLGDVSISNGTATYKNAQSGAAFSLAEINLDIALPSLDDPFAANGSAVWQGDKVALELAAERPRAFVEGGKTPVALKISAPKLNAAYQGDLQPLGGLAFGGNVDLSVPSVRELAKWVGNPMPAGGGFGPLAIKGVANGSGNSYSFSKAEIGFDGMNATGNMKVTTGGARPRLTGQLAFDKIDVNTYLAGETGGASGGSASGATGGGDGGWSNEPIDLSGLKAVDADLALSASEILVQKIRIGASALHLALNSGMLNVSLDKLALYEGAGQGKLTLNGTSATPQLAASFGVGGVSAGPLLTDAAGFSRLEGKSVINFDVTASGRSQRAMVSALNGKGAVKFTNGSIKGINIAGLVRNVLSAATTGWQSGGAQDTDFSELGGTFTIANGILSNNDLKMLSPLVRIAGSGTVNMPDKTLKYRIEPKLAATLEGQGGNADVKGIEVPIIVEGPWASPRFRPDLQSMLSNPQNTLETIDTLKKEGGKGLLKSLMGQPSGSTAPADGSAPATGTSPSDDGAGTTTPPAPQTPADALKDILGR